MSLSGAAWRHGDACVIVHFRLTPKSSKKAIDGICETANGPAFQAWVRSAPSDGASNDEFVRLVAAWLRVSKRDVTLVAGGKSRLKSVRIEGDVDDLEGRLNKRLGTTAQK